MKLYHSGSSYILFIKYQIQCNGLDSEDLYFSTSTVDIDNSEFSNKINMHLPGHCETQRFSAWNLKSGLETNEFVLWSKILLGGQLSLQIPLLLTFLQAWRNYE